MTLQNPETGRLPKPILGLAVVGFLVPSATILQTLAMTWTLAQHAQLAALLPIVIGCGAIARIFSGIPLTFLIQRWGARHACLASLMSGAITLLATATVLAGLMPFWLLIPSEIILGTAITGFSISRQMLIQGVLHGEGESLAAGLSRSAAYLSKLVVPLIGGLLLTAWAPPYATMVCCGVLAISTGLIASTDTDTPRRAVGVENTLTLARRIAIAVAYYKREHTLVCVLGFTAVLNFVLAPVGVIMPLYIAAIEGASSAYLGFSESCLGAGAVCGALAYAKLRRCHLPSVATMTGCGFLLLFASVGLDGAWGYPLFNTALLCIGACVAFAGSVADALLMSRLQPDTYGRILGVQALIVGAAFPMGLFVASVLLRFTDALHVIAAYNAGLCLVAALMLQLGLGKAGVEPVPHG
ncbi:MFS transporter [Cupriavidus alkaliphilus]|uniref:MFS family permease n=1 Tax=Cupriavidus alkaliphilus TaxID=942866 RepID=A0A7W4VD74_9BURK|nr:MFS transporter [Cupriavidus alkaliphilus]MBB3009441.1 MFS family permease [Cupriavidus alkaliphilus]